MCRKATTALRLDGSCGPDPGLASCLGQPWAMGHNAVGVGGGVSYSDLDSDSVWWRPW